MPLQATLDEKLSPFTGWTINHWHEVLADLVKGCLRYSSEEKGMINYPGGKESMYGNKSDGMEGFIRASWMIAPYLTHSHDGMISIDGKPFDVAGYMRQGILAGTDPGNPDYWGEIKTRHQTIVESGSLAMNMFLAKKHLWDKMTPQEQAQLAAWFQTIIGKEPYQNNWLLFQALVNVFLKITGNRYEPKEIDANIDYINRVYHGDGWYRDGKAPCFDYYNPWSLQAYPLIWAMMDGDSRPDLAARFREQAALFLENFKYFFAGNGNYVPFGRSLIYRMGAVSIFGLAEFAGISPIEPGQARRIASGNVKFFADNNAIENHHLTMGYTKRNLRIPERYSGTGSPYWAAKCFMTLLNAPSSPFWTDIEQPLEVEKGDYIKAIPSTGQILQGDRETGQVVNLVNNSHHWVQKKYSNYVYSSHFGFEVAHNGDNTGKWNFHYDGGFFVSNDGGKTTVCRMYPRHIKTEDCFSASYFHPFCLDWTKPYVGNEDTRVTVFSSIIMRPGYHIRIHKILTDREFFAYDGGFALGYNQGVPLIRSGQGWEWCGIDGRASFIMGLHGFTGQVPARGFDGNTAGNNLLQDFSIVPALTISGTAADLNNLVLVSLVCATLKGTVPEELTRLVQSVQVTGDLVRIVFSDDEETVTRIGASGTTTFELRNSRLSGDILFSRSGNDGKYVTVYKVMVG